MDSGLSVHSSVLKTSLRIEAKDTAPQEKTTLPILSSRIPSFVVIYSMIFFNGCCFTAVAPSVPFYLQVLKAPPEFLGWVVSFYSVGQIIGSPIAGWLSHVLTSKNILLISSTLGLASSLVYAVALNHYFVLASRLLTGISAGMEFTTELTFIANNTTFAERTTFLATVTACNVLGFILGPALASVVATWNLTIGRFVVDQYTGPGWLLTIMFMIDLCMVTLFFKNNVLVPREEDDIEEPSSLQDERAELLSERKEHQSDARYGSTIKERLVKPSAGEQSATVPTGPEGSNGREFNDNGAALPLILSLIFVQFSLMCGFSLVETITSPLVHDEFGWNVPDCNLLFTCGGAFSLVVYVVFVVASKRVQDRYLIVTSLVLCSVGFLLAIDWRQLDWVPEWVPEWISKMSAPYLTCFLFGFLLIYGGFMTGRSVVFALYSKLVAQDDQGNYLSWMVAGGSAARTLGPFVAVKIYYGLTAPGKNLLVLFGSIGTFHLACLALVLCQWPELIPTANKSSHASRSAHPTESESKSKSSARPSVKPRRRHAS